MPLPYITPADKLALYICFVLICNKVIAKLALIQKPLGLLDYRVCAGFGNTSMLLLF